ncbi:hypothetical protein LTR10_007867 [Elasticomyces elasticus]|nr:hypothetical protein LTR10_007867 [Elasticomyces elasticus]KAK4970867.1 hypothetical protein LTR42_007844 [Elasticomyces elasticus]
MHLDTGDRPHKCYLCNDTFSRDDYLKRHFLLCSIRRGTTVGLGDSYGAPTTPAALERGRSPSRASTLPKRDSSVSSVRSMIDDRMQWANTERSSSRASSLDTSASPFRSESPFEGEYRRNSGYDSSDSYDRPLLSPEFQTVVEAFHGMRTKSDSEIAECEDRFDRTPSISPPYMRPQGNPQKHPADIDALMRNPTMLQYSETRLTSLRAHCRHITPAQPRTVEIARSPEEALVAILLIRDYLDQQPDGFVDDQEYLTIEKIIDRLRLQSYANTDRRLPVQSARSRSPSLNEMDDHWQGLGRALPQSPRPAARTSDNRVLPNVSTVEVVMTENIASDALAQAPGDVSTATLIHSAALCNGNVGKSTNALVNVPTKYSSAASSNTAIHSGVVSAEELHQSDMHRLDSLDRAHGFEVPSDPVPTTADQGSMSTFTPDHRGQKRRAQSPLQNSAPGSTPSFTCDTCGKTFSRRTLRDNHIRTHSDDRTFACSIQGCDEIFKQKNEQARHEKAQHAPKQFVCGGITSGRRWGCGKAFARRDGLQEHHTKTAKGAQCFQAGSGLM